MHLFRRLLASGTAVPLLLATAAQAQPAAPTTSSPTSTPPAAAPPAAAPPAAAPPAAAAPEAAAPTPDAAPSSPETLETPYADTPAPPPKPAPAAPPPPSNGYIQLKPQAMPADSRPGRPIRAQRRVALLGEIGWNGLAGVGAVVTYHANPHFSIDMAGGISAFGWKGGVRGRYNFMTSSFTPFVGLGFNATSGLGQVTSNPKDESNPDPNAQPFTLEVKPSYLAQAVVGFELTRARGFTMQAALGYARLLNHDNTRLIDGSMTADEKQAVDVFFKSGPVISMAFGHSFQ
jgi:hypothetical protein